MSVLLILYRILHHPSGGASVSIPGAHYSYSFGIKIGIWLGLISAGALTYGGYEAMKAEGTTLSDVRDQASSAVAGARESAASHSSAPQSAAQPATPAPPVAPETPPPPIPPRSEPAGA